MTRSVSLTLLLLLLSAIIAQRRALVTGAPLSNATLAVSSALSNVTLSPPSPVVCNDDKALVQPVGLSAVDVDFHLSKILGIDDTSGVFSVVGGLSVRWTNPCAWTAASKRLPTAVAEHQGFVIAEPREIGWQPNLFLKNAADSNSKAGGEVFAQTLMVFRNGDVESWTYGLWKAECRLEVISIPFDLQSCSLVFESQQPLTAMHFKQVSFTNESGLMDNSLTSRWHLADLYALGGAATEKASCMKMGRQVSRTTVCWPQVSFVFNVQRQYQPYVVTVLIPCFGQVITHLATLAMPPNSQDRPTVSVVIVLIFAVYEINMWQELGLSTSDNAIIAFISVSMVFSFVATFYILIIFGFASSTIGEEGTSGDMLAHLRRRQYRRCRTVDIIAFILFFALILAAYIYCFILMIDY